jgi:hypothetical protein
VRRQPRIDTIGWTISQAADVALAERCDPFALASRPAARTQSRWLGSAKRSQHLLSECSLALNRTETHQKSLCAAISSTLETDHQWPGIPAIRMSLKPEDMHMYALNERVSALESIFSKVNLGDWGGDVPWWVAIRVRPLQDGLSKLGPHPEPWRDAASIAFEQQLVGAVLLAAQAKAMQGSQAEGLNRLTSEIIDDWCPTHPRPFPPRPHWGAVVEQLGILGDRFPTGSLLSEAAFDLARRVVNRAHEAHKHVDSQ